ncbi:MAG: class I SAM-dependent methyltransferase [Sulfuricaulis sp.]
MKTAHLTHQPMNRAPPEFTPATIGIMAVSAASETRAQQLAAELGLPLSDPSGSGEFTLLLVCAHERLELHDARDPRTGPVCVDYSRLDRRPDSANLSRRQPLARALGKKTRTVVDTTAGYCQDALLLALMGFHVCAIERSPVVVALVQDGLRRFSSQSGMDMTNRLRLMPGDARTLLLSIAPRPDAIYLDPMFPPKRKKSAAVKKEMRLLRALVGDDPDAAELLDISRRVALQRVVVKRPDDALPLTPDPSMSISGKLVRYDVYLTHG